MKIDKTTKNKTHKAKPKKIDASSTQTDAALPKTAATKSRSSTQTSQTASSKISSPTPKSFSLKSQHTAPSTDEVANEEVAACISKADIKEAARILKSGGSKKRERRKAASVMSVAGSSKGGQNRARNLSPEKLKEIATLGGLARQAKARERAEQGLPNTRPRRAPMARSLSGDTR